MASGFRYPGGDSRTCVIGATGSGKTTCSLWLLAHQRLDKRPWVIFDFKVAPEFDLVGIPPIEEWSLHSRPPRGKGLYLVSPLPHQAEEVEEFLWRIFHRGNCGIYIDEVALMPPNDAFTAIMQQGRAKKIPVICCTQRPVGVPRQVFSEAWFFCCFRMADKRDYKIVEGFVPADLAAPLPRYQWRWYDAERQHLLKMAPVPRPEIVAEELRLAIPQRDSWHPFAWTARPTGRPSLKIVK